MASSLPRRELVDIIIVQAGTVVTVAADAPQHIIIPNAGVEILAQARYLDPDTGEETDRLDDAVRAEVRHVITTDWKEQPRGR